MWRHIYRPSFSKHYICDVTYIGWTIITMAWRFLLHELELMSILIQYNHVNKIKSCDSSRAWWISPLMSWPGNFLPMSVTSPRAQPYQPKIPEQSTVFCVDFQISKNAKRFLKVGVIWNNFKEHFLIHNWLAKPKHLQDNFSEIRGRNRGSKISDFCRKFLLWW